MEQTILQCSIVRLWIGGHTFQMVEIFPGHIGLRIMTGG